MIRNGKSEYSEEQIWAADVNCTNSINVNDTLQNLIKIRYGILEETEGHYVSKLK